MVVTKKHAIVGCAPGASVASYSMAQGEFKRIAAAEINLPPDREFASCSCTWEQILQILEEYGLDPASSREGNSAEK
jgi:hypothetical protein